MSNDVDISPEEVLQHFGIKGMRWGQRQAARRELNSAISGAKLEVDLAKENLSALKGHRREQRINTAKTVAKIGAVGAVLAGGAVMAKRILGNRGPTKVKDISPKFMAAGKDWIVETNSGEAFDITMKVLHESGRLKP